MFKDEFEALDPTKNPFEDAAAAKEATGVDTFGSGLDPEERSFRKYPAKIPLLKVSDSNKFTPPSQQ